MKQAFFQFLTVVSVALILISCNGRSKNQKIVEAQKIHQTMLAKYDSIYSALKTQEVLVEKKLKSLSPHNPDRAAYQSMERSINRSYKLLGSWRQSVSDVPGFEPEEPNSEKNEDQVDTEGMSDQEILDLQNAYSDKLDQIDQKINELVTTIDMYTK